MVLYLCPWLEKGEREYPQQVSMERYEETIKAQFTSMHSRFRVTVQPSQCTAIQACNIQSQQSEYKGRGVAYLDQPSCVQIL